MRKNIIIALDLEGTLISNAVSQFPRPGLYEFLEYCHHNFSRIVIFTAVSEVHFRKVAMTLSDLGDVPNWFVDLEYINWHGEYKDLSFVTGFDSQQAIIVDDRVEYINPEQKDRLIYIPEYAYPYSKEDKELNKLVQKLSQIN